MLFLLAPLERKDDNKGGAARSSSNISPVFEEPLYAKSHKLEQGLNDEDEREDVVTILQNLL